MRRRQPEKPVFDFRARFCHSASHGHARFRLQTPGQGPGGPTAISYQYEVEEEDTHFGSEPVAATGARPCMMHVLGRAKFDAWAARKGLAREQAMADYVMLAASLKAREAETV